MYLEKFIIKNFRCIEYVSLSFNKGLNILIGENNTGKTAIIDALRLCLSYGNQRRDIFVSNSDFHVNRESITNSQTEIEFHLFFQIDNPEEAGWFNDLHSVHENGTEDLQLHFRYFVDQNERIKYRVWGGSKEGQTIAPEVLFLIYHVHLDALRDAEQYLKPIKGNRLGQLYANIQIDEDHAKDLDKKRELAKKVRSAVDSDYEWIGHISKGKDRINEHLTETCFTDKQQQVDISFLPFDFNKLVDNLKIQMPVYTDQLLEGDPSKQKYFELYQNGLGYNNLIYIATVLGDLKQRKQLQKESYAVLLIEEPEAHLHPQLQNVFFNYINKLDSEHGFQLFISSHSPTITAKADLKSIIVLQNQGNKFHSLSLNKSGLKDENKTYLQKFLDVTKSQLFFSNAVILVEGISEALLMKIFSQKIGVEYNIEKSGIELVNLNGVAFSHFANLFNNEDSEKNLISRCAIITDDDRTELDEDGSPRADKVIALAGGSLKVYAGEQTFEYELFKTSKANRELLLRIYKEFHPLTTIVSDQNINIYSKNFADKVKLQKGKSELALRLATHLENGAEISRILNSKSKYSSLKEFVKTLTNDQIVDYKAYRDFKVPTYIQNAIKYAVKGE